MRAALCKEYGSPPRLEIGDVVSPTLNSTDLRIEVHACGINFADVLLVQGKYQAKPDLPFVPGNEVAGTIIEMGSDIDGFEVGQRVIALSQGGGFAEEVVVNSDRVLPLSDRMDFVSGASFPTTYGTSHLALDHRAHLKAGETLLVLGASGGVGLTAVEIGKAMGATVIAAASSREKLAIAEEHGADHLINYVEEDLRDSVMSLCGGVDVVYDGVGKDTFEKSLICLKARGMMVSFGNASGALSPIDVPKLLQPKGLFFVRPSMGQYLGTQNELNEAARDLFEKIKFGKVKNKIYKEYKLSEAKQAHKDLESRKIIGPAVIIP